MHYIGGTADSSDHTRILRRIMGEIKRRYDLPEDIPTDNEKLTEAFPDWLVQATARGRFVLVLDALNQIEERDNAPDLGWLPIYFPPNIRVIVSTLPGRSMRAIEKRDWSGFTVGPLTEKERRRVIVEYLGLYVALLPAKPGDLRKTACQQTAMNVTEKQCSVPYSRWCVPYPPEIFVIDRQNELD